MAREFSRPLQAADRLPADPRRRRRLDRVHPQADRRRARPRHGRAASCPPSWTRCSRSPTGSPSCTDGRIVGIVPPDIAREEHRPDDGRRHRPRRPRRHPRNRALTDRHRRRRPRRPRRAARRARRTARDGPIEPVASRGDRPPTRPRPAQRKRPPGATWLPHGHVLLAFVLALVVGAVLMSLRHRGPASTCTLLLRRPGDALQRVAGTKVEHRVRRADHRARSAAAGRSPRPPPRPRR